MLCESRTGFSGRWSQRRIQGWGFCGGMVGVRCSSRGRWEWVSMEGTGVIFYSICRILGDGGAVDNIRWRLFLKTPVAWKWNKI